MFVLKNRDKTVYSSLVLQLTVLLLLSLLLGSQKPNWGMFSFLGGMAIWLPNVLFAFFIKQEERKEHVERVVNWALVVGEFTKVIMTIVLLLTLFKVFNAAFLPVFIAFTAVTMIQIFVPFILSLRH